MSIELFVQPHTVITILGPMPEAPQQPINYREITIEGAGRVIGPVLLTGFVKLPFERIVTNNSTYGSAVITDAVRYKLNVFVTSFDETQGPPLGSHISVRGHMRRSDAQQLILQVTTMAQIHVVDDEVRTEEQMRAGFRIPQRARLAGENVNAAPAAPVRRAIADVDTEEGGIDRPVQRPRLELNDIASIPPAQPENEIQEVGELRDERGV